MAPAAAPLNRARGTQERRCRRRTLRENRGDGSAGPSRAVRRARSRSRARPRPTTAARASDQAQSQTRISAVAEPDAVIPVGGAQTRNVGKGNMRADNLPDKKTKEEPKKKDKKEKNKEQNDPERAEPRAAKPPGKKAQKEPK